VRSNIPVKFSSNTTNRSYKRKKLITSSRQAPIRWFEPEAYKAKLAAAGPVAILPISEAETDPEWSRAKSGPVVSLPLFFTRLAGKASENDACDSVVLVFVARDHSALFPACFICLWTRGMFLRRERNMYNHRSFFSAVSPRTHRCSQAFTRSGAERDTIVGHAL